MRLTPLSLSDALWEHTSERLQLLVGPLPALRERMHAKHLEQWPDGGLLDTLRSLSPSLMFLIL